MGKITIIIFLKHSLHRGTIFVECTMRMKKSLHPMQDNSPQDRLHNLKFSRIYKVSILKDESRHLRNNLIVKKQ